MSGVAARFAARELRAGIGGFRIFLACLALGVAAIAAASSTAEAFRQGLASQAREILGGDLAISVEQRGFTPAEQADFGRLGRVVYSAGARAMAESSSGERRLVELRGVGPGYPLAGAVQVRGAADLAHALAPEPDGTPGAAVEPALLDRLGLKLGDQFRVGNSVFVAHAVLVSEPDRIGRGFALGPRVLTTLAAVRATGLLDAGSLHTETARIALTSNVAPAKAARSLRGRPDADLDIRDRGDAAPGARRLIDRLEYFLGFIGLASLLAGGLGVFGAVSAYLETRKASIAVLKALGAEGALIRDVYLIQIGVLATLGVAIGLTVGAAIPLLIGALAKDQLPIPALFAVYPGPLAGRACSGCWPPPRFRWSHWRGRARLRQPHCSAATSAAPRRWGQRQSARYLAGLGLAGLTLLTAPTILTAVVMIAGVAVALGLLWALGRVAVWAAGRLRRLTRGALKLGLANLAGPRSAARTATPAIGLGVALLTTVVLIQSSLLAQVSAVAPKTAPAVVFTEIPAGSAEAFDAAVAAGMGALRPDRYLRFPFVTGRIVGLKGRPVDRKAIRESGRWAYDNDISLSTIGAAPAGAGVVQGAWWPANYAGPPEVVLEQSVAAAGGLRVGDAVTLSVLGREIEARVAALRKVDFGGFGPSFALVIDPAALAGADLRNIAIAKMSRAQEAALTRSLGRDFPGVNVISVREQLEAASDLSIAWPWPCAAPRPLRRWLACSCWPVRSRRAPGRGRARPPP